MHLLSDDVVDLLRLELRESDVSNHSKSKTQSATVCDVQNSMSRSIISCSRLFQSGSVQKRLVTIVNDQLAPSGWMVVLVFGLSYLVSLRLFMSFNADQYAYKYSQPLSTL